MKTPFKNKFSSKINTSLAAAGSFYQLPRCAREILMKIVDGESCKRKGLFSDVYFGKRKFQKAAKCSESSVEDSWKLLKQLNMIEIIPRPGSTHYFKINNFVYEFCVQLRFCNLHINSKKYLKEVMEGIECDPLFLVHKYQRSCRRKPQKVPPPKPQKVPPIRTSSLIRQTNRVRIPTVGYKKPPIQTPIHPIVSEWDFFTDYEKQRISLDFHPDVILEAKRDMDNYQYKFMKVINSRAGYIINALHRQKNRKLKWDL